MNLLKAEPAPAYEREVNVKSISPQILASINASHFQDEEVVSNISLTFSSSMEMTARVYLTRMPDNDALNKLKINLVEIFQLDPDKVSFINGGLYE